MGRKLDLTGQRFGLLTVIREAAEDEMTEAQRAKKEGMWACICDCGAVKIARTGALRHGMCKSCGASVHRINNIGYLKAANYALKVHGDMHGCKYNVGLNCDLISCDGCGWNPKIAEARKAALHKK